MKTILCLVVTVIICVRLAAQAQELQQLKLNLEKLAQFKMMLGEMKKGYQTMQNGYNSVRDATRGNYDIHKTYLDGLFNVSAVVKNTPAIQSLFSNQRVVLSEYRKALQQFRSTALFNPAELAEMDATYSMVIKNISANLDHVMLVLTPGRLRMSDGERIAAIEQIVGDSEKQRDVLRKLTKENSAIAVLRAQQKKDMQALRKLSGLK